MNKVGIFFGTDSGTTRLIAKKIAKNIKRRLGEQAVSKPLNMNRATPATLLEYRALILGTPSYLDGALPGLTSGNSEASWLEFLPELVGKDFTGIKIALYGLGDQESYPDHFVDAMMDLHRFFDAAGAELIGTWPDEGYEFSKSRAWNEGLFVGLALDQHLQHLLTDQRIDRWLDDILPQFDTPSSSQLNQAIA